VQQQTVPNACAVGLTRTCLRKTWLRTDRQLYTQQLFLRTVFWLLDQGDVDGTPRGLLLEQGAAFSLGSARDDAVMKHAGRNETGPPLDAVCR
jgi:hypothetical protein